MNQSETQRLYEAAKATEPVECEHCDGPFDQWDERFNPIPCRYCDSTRRQGGKMAQQYRDGLIGLLDYAYDGYNRRQQTALIYREGTVSRERTLASGDVYAEFVGVIAAALGVK